ncbi:MAG: hypothetical protein FJ112_07830 [Deltaproteobacteria bacterium]|nr:hypothetical protein [Deltaproteobacteria bacterium]
MNRQSKKLELIFFLVSLAVCLVISEFAIRFYKRDIAYQPDPKTIRSLLPNIKRRIESYDTEANLNQLSRDIPNPPVFLGYDYTNGQGLRMSEDIQPKKTNEKRILLLGDSFTEADGVLEKDRFFKIAQAVLQEKHSSIKIINGGIQNGSPVQYAIQLLEWLPKFQPDAVIIATGANDHTDDYEFERLYGVTRDGSDFPIEIKNRLYLWLLQKSYSLRYFDVFVSRFFPKLWNLLHMPTEPNNSSEKWMELYCNCNPTIKKSFENYTGKHLTAIKSFIESKGLKFGVLVINYNFIFPEPYYEKRFPGLEAELEKAGCKRNLNSPYNEFIDNFLNKNKITFKNTITSLKQAHLKNPKQNLWGFWDYHFSIYGNPVVAKDLLELIEMLDL